MIGQFALLTLWALLIVISGMVSARRSGLLWGMFLGAFGAYCFISLGWTP